MIHDLKLLGLTDNEIKTYVAILEIGTCTGTELRRKTQISNSQTYAAIDSLLSKGLINYEKHYSGKKYSALDPTILQELAKEREQKIISCIPYLKSLRSNEKETQTAVFEGFNGFKSALYQLVENCPRNETLHIIGFSNQAYKNNKLASLLRDVNKKSKEKKHKFKMILDNKNNTFYEQRKNEKISEIRFMEKGFKSPASIDVFQDYVYILLWEKTPYAIVIKNKNIADGFKIYFDFLWNMAKK